MEEFFDWVDRYDHIIGITSREDVTANLFHRAVHLYVGGESAV